MKMLTEDELCLIMHPGNVLFDIVETVWKYENKYHVKNTNKKQK